MTADLPWFVRSFDGLYPWLYAHRTIHEAFAIAPFVARVLNFRPGMRVLDLCCGNGRHVAAMHTLGMDVYGLDLSRDLLREAKHRICPSRPYVRSDMRRVPFAERTFDAVTQFFTSFGYFDDPADDRRVVAEVGRVLRHGGRWFFDFLNAVAVRERLEPETVLEKDGHRIIHRRFIDPATRRVHRETTIEKDGTIVDERREAVRLYDRDELENLFQMNGLIVREVFGSLAGDPFTRESARLVLVAEKEHAR